MLISGAYSDTPSQLQAATNDASPKSTDTGWVLVRQAGDHGTVQRVAITSPSFQIGRQPPIIWPSLTRPFRAGMQSCCRLIPICF
jgi:hypothetical protein